MVLLDNGIRMGRYQNGNAVCYVTVSMATYAVKFLNLINNCFIRSGSPHEASSASSYPFSRAQLWPVQVHGGKCGLGGAYDI